MLNFLDEEPLLFISMLMRQSYAEGLGKRFVIYLADLGRYDHLDANESERIQTRQKHSVSSVFNEIKVLKPEIDGLSLIIADPCEQGDALAELSRLVKGIDLGITLFSQRSFADLRSQAASDKAIRMLLLNTDNLVDQAYLPQLKCENYAWQGSSNQSLHILNKVDKQLRLKRFQEQKPSIELRVKPRFQSQTQSKIVHSDLFQTDLPHYIYRNGWPHAPRVNQEKKVDSKQRLNLSQLNGKQWIEDLLFRECPRINPKALWPKNEAYWVQVLTVIKQRCMKWLIQTALMPSAGENDYSLVKEVSYPIIVSDGQGNLSVKQLLSIDQDLWRFPLVFGPATQAIFSGPCEWKASITSHEHSKTRAKSIEVPSLSSKSVTVTPLDLDYKKRMFLGDWVLLVSLYNKLTRLKMMNWLCCELLEKKTHARSSILSWLYNYSPLLLIFEPGQGQAYSAEDQFQQLDLSDQNIRSFLRLICPSLPIHWTKKRFIERVHEGFFSADTWEHLEAIAGIHNFAWQSNFFALAEACIKTVAKLLEAVEVQDYFALSAPSMEALRLHRIRRLKIVQLSQIWDLKVQAARESIYGDEDYLEAQVLLSFVQRWRKYDHILRGFIAYAEVILNSDES